MDEELRAKFQKVASRIAEKCLQLQREPRGLIFHEEDLLELAVEAWKAGLEGRVPDRLAEFEDDDDGREATRGS